MASTLPLLGAGEKQQSPSGNASPGGPQLASQAGSFSQAMERADQAVGREVATGAVGEASPAAGDQARARQALELGVAPDTSRTETGDAILGGMQKLRGAFDASFSRIGDISRSNLSGVETVIEMQREVVHYSLLIDVTSKLVGKATQAADQLMKGQ